MELKIPGNISLELPRVHEVANIEINILNN